MITRRFKRGFYGLTSMVLVLSLLAACNNNNNTSGPSNSPVSPSQGTSESASPAKLEPLEYTFWAWGDTPPTVADDANDVVAKFVDDKFKLKVKEIYVNNGMSRKERLNLFLSTDSLPDVVFDINDNTTIPETGKYAELGDLVKQYAPNLLEAYPEEQWKDAMYKGKLYNFPAVLTDGNDPMFINDIYVNPMGNWAGIWVKESDLKSLGYTFTSTKDLAKKVNETQTKPTVDDLKIEPAIATPDDFYNFLKKLKEAKPKVDGKDLIPFTIPVYLQPHFGAMFGLTTQWKYDPNSKQVSQFLGDPNAKAYWEYMNKLYNEGLLDKNFAIQKDDQLQENIVQGRVGAFMWAKDIPKVQEAVTQKDPNDSLRLIPLPKQPGTTFVGIDGVNKATFKFYIRKDFKDVKRLVELFNWSMSQEYLELITWGPEELGLWEMKDGKKVWKDEEFHQAILTNNADILNEKYYKYGLGLSKVSSKIFATTPTPAVNPWDWKRSYPFVVDPNDVVYFANFISNEGIQWKGYIGTAVSETSQLAPSYVSGEFQQQQSAKLFAAKNQEEFDKNWNDIMKANNVRMKYDDAKKEMEEYFESIGFEVQK